MHIAMLSAEYPPRWGGMGSVVFHLAGHLAKLGHEITIITRNGSTKPPSQEGVTVVSIMATITNGFYEELWEKCIESIKEITSQKFR